MKIAVPSAIVKRIGVRLIDFDRYHFLLPGGYPHRITVRGPSGLSAMWHYIFHGLLPWYHNILYMYSVLDMISRPLSEKSFLDRVSQIGLLRGRWYTSESVAELGQETVLKASAIPVYDLSAMTAKRIASYWVRQVSPFLSILPGDLQTVFIDPQVRELENSNTGVPLFINTIEAWPNRPRPKTKIKNLYLAGDFVKNAIDLACMEGAVSSALEAAAHILEDHGETGSLPVVQVPPVWSAALLVAARIVFVPIVAVARVIAWLEEKFSPHRPDASEVRRRATPKLQMDARPPRKR